MERGSTRRGRHPGRTSHIAHSLGRGTNKKGQFRVLVPLANPKTAEILVKLAAAVAKAKGGEILLLRVIRIPEQLPTTAFSEEEVEKEEAWLKRIRKIPEAENIPAHALIRVGHNIARAILETSYEHHCSLIVLGWKGFATRREMIFGQTTEAVIMNARSDIMFVKMTGDKLPSRILLPTAESDHAQCAEQYATALVRQFDGALTLCQVANVHEEEDELVKVKQHLEEAEQRLLQMNGNTDLPKLKTIEQRILRNDSISRGIINEGQNYDAVIVGATRKSSYTRTLFGGGIPLEIAKELNTTVIVVKHYHPVKALLGRVVGE